MTILIVNPVAARGRWLAIRCDSFDRKSGVTVLIVNLVAVRGKWLPPSRARSPSNHHLLLTRTSPVLLPALSLNKYFTEAISAIATKSYKVEKL